MRVQILLDLPARLVNMWRSPQTSPALGEVRTAALESLYAEVCKAHDAITNFRGKLLALVPTLSGAAFALIIGTREDFNLRLLLPVGIFGAAVTLGLFFYELRGMLLCVELRNRGEKLEQAMQRPATDVKEMNGHFLKRPERHKIGAALKLLKDNWPISVPTASFIVYGSAILGWVLVAAFGVVSLCPSRGRI
jgi:hypothetical protein